MAAAASRSTANTTLILGKVEVGIGLFSTVAKPKGLATFETAGPNGGVLVAQQHAAERPLSSSEPMPEMSAEKGDPLGADPGSEAPPIAEAPASAPAKGDAVPGEYERALIEQGTGQVVEPDEVRKGIRKGDGTFIDLTEHLKQIESETKLEKMEIVKFVRVETIDRARIDASYYIGAQEAHDAKPLRLIYEAMKLRRRVAVVKWSSKSRQSLGVLVAHGTDETLMLYKLTWAEDFREAPARARSVARATVSPQEIDIAAQLVDAMGDSVEALDELRDDAIALREELIARALAGEVEAIETPPSVEETMGTAEAFEESLAEMMAVPRAGKA